MRERVDKHTIYFALFIVMASIAIFPCGARSFAAERAIADSMVGQGPSRPVWGLLRVRSVGYRLARANPTRCPVPTMQTGLILHDVGGFSKADRASAMRGHGLTYGFGILDLVPESPAMRAGLRRRDEIVGINGFDLAGFAGEAITRKASYDRVAAFENLLQSELRKGSANLTVRRGQRYLPVLLEAEPGCGGHFTELNTKRLNAWSNGRYVTVSSAMLRFAPDDGELAFVMAHEMAHNILQHNADKSAAGLVPGRNGKRQGSRQREIEADRFAIEIMRNAGYDPQGAQRLLERIGAFSSQRFALSHPSIGRRIATVDRAIKAMAEDARAGLPGETATARTLRIADAVIATPVLVPALPPHAGVAPPNPSLRLSPSFQAGLQPVAIMDVASLSRGRFASRTAQAFDVSAILGNRPTMQSRDWSLAEHGSSVLN